MAGEDWARQRLRLLSGRFALCRLGPQDPMPRASSGELTVLLRTRHDLTLICPQEDAPTESECEPGWRCLEVEGPLDPETVGVLAALSGALARAGVPILAASSYETDFIFVRQRDLPAAREALQAEGHVVYE